MAAIYPDLSGKVVIVTGGAGGIGEAIARSFVRQGCKVGVLDLDAERGRRLQEELADGDGTLRFAACDLTDIPALKAAIADLRAALGPVDVLINNAANDQRHATLEVTEDYWDGRIAVNLRHQFFAAQAVLPDMMEKQGGVILNMGSNSWMIGQGGMAAYTACKSAVLGLTRSLARDFGPHGVRVNAVAPGWIMTERQLELWVTPETEKEIYQRQCLKRKLVPDDIARFVVFMASEDAGACTNQHYVVDGGWV
ncbi:NAD(P)-dependent dehydrogenase (short-subunit alcohol dehydrogenase family) [Brevundimonas alba]|uniref:D-xylose 1-dehydrogenase n=1 Tax=Brevundimonas alba TaxID=74314 RepID=A0A7X6BM04_9CAUL|nr:SDR family oxidoreductase [Brevundimonas alba]NJC39847.1 NAD(P)-dependent dehydrogenase (short-subunit alcohol dehydrogenase family) [Brevundimonas alba]